MGWRTEDVEVEEDFVGAEEGMVPVEAEVGATVVVVVKEEAEREVGGEDVEEDAGGTTSRWCDAPHPSCLFSFA